MRPIFVTPSSRGAFPRLYDDCHTIICLTASHSSHHPQDYIQGAGDDSENWGAGLTPDLHWSHKHQLLGCEEEGLKGLIYDLVWQIRGDSQSPSLGAPGCREVFIKPVPNITITNLRAESLRIDNYDGSILLGQNLPYSIAHLSEGCPGSITSSLGLKYQGLPMNLNPLVKPLRTPHFFAHLLPEGKVGSRLLPKLLAHIHDFVATLTDKVFPSLKKTHPPQLLFACATGTDFSVAAALTILCLFHDADRSWVGEAVNEGKVDKMMVKQRLSWITEKDERAIPSRASMTRVHGYLMKKPEGES